MEEKKEPQNIEPSKVLQAIEDIKSSSLDPELKAFILQILNAFGTLLRIIDKKNTTMGKLRRFLFKKTESSKNILGAKDKSTDKDKKDPDDSTGTTGGGSSSSEKPNEKKGKGHGRNAHTDYAITKEINCSHNNLTNGEQCPHCKEGTIYKLEPSNFIQLMAQPMINATRYVIEKSRCNACLNIFEANLPEGVLPQKYDPSVGVHVAVLKASGMPHYRMESLLAAQGIPLSDSQMHELEKELAQGVEPIVKSLIKNSSESGLFHIDDTTARVQELTLENQKQEKKDRKGVFTSVVNAAVDSHPTSLFFIGRDHAGEAMAEVLKNRIIPAPFQVMADGSSKNPTDHEDAIDLNCNSHNRRNFADIQTAFPLATEFVVKAYKEIYKNESQCKEDNFSPSKRLEYHREHSLPIMAGMKKALELKLINKETEPNSVLGEAIKYFLKRYEKLIGFCTHEGAPIDNNLCERTIKKFVLLRKNSLHYKTKNGAKVGEKLLTIIQTAIENKVNPFNYLITVMKNLKAVGENPDRWYPWNYHLNLSPAAIAA